MRVSAYVRLQAVAALMLWLILTLGIVAAAGCLWLGSYAFNEWLDNGWAFVGTMALGIAALTLIVVASVPLVARAAGEASCSSWGAQTGYQTKFRVLWALDTGTCLARLPNGKWVANSSVFTNTPQR